MKRILVLALVLTGFSAAPPVAGAVGEQFGGYEGSALGSAFTAGPRIPATVPYVDEPFEGTISHTMATLATGGQGTARASSVWPGTAVAGIGVLVDTASGRDTPIPEEYPLVVEARDSDDRKQHSAPGVTMVADADPDRSEAQADASGFGVPGAFEIRSARSVSRALLGKDALTTTATSTVQGVTFGGGAVYIDEVTSVATTTTNARTSTCSSKVDVSGMKVGDTPATVDSGGVHAGEGTAVPGVDPNKQIADVLGASGISMRVIGGSGRCEGANATQSAGGLLVELPTPAVAAVSAGSFKVVLASVASAASATPPSSFDAPTFVPGVAAGSGGALPNLRDSLARAPGPATGGGFTDPIGSTDDSGDGGDDGGQTALGFDPASAGEGDGDYEFDGLPAGFVVAAILALVLGVRLIRRFMERLFVIGS